MADSPKLTLVSTVLGTPDPRGLADFYRQLLGWQIKSNEEDWVTLKPASGDPGLAFQLEDAHVPPVWPSGPGDQQMQAHLDILVDDLPAAQAHAESLGATLAEFQPQEDNRVYLDPAGHPFCLFLS